MRVAEVVIDVPAGAQSSAERAAYALGAQGLEVRDRDHGVPRGRVHVVLWLPSSTPRAMVQRALGHIEGARVHVRRVEAEWWTAPAPRPIGTRFVIVSDDTASRSRRIPIRVDSTLTFGDGQHATTALCVAALEKVIATRRVSSLLDVGTGTGVLAIVGAKLGVDDIVATDIDPLAREAARRALRVNDVRARVQTALPARRFDCVIANLYFEPLLAMARALSERVADGGALVVSGFTRVSAVEAAFAEQGLRVQQRRTRDGFGCLTLLRGDDR